MCGSVDTWMCGYVNVRMGGCDDAWMCGCVDVWIIGCVDLRMFAFREFYSLLYLRFSVWRQIISSEFVVYINTML